MFKWLAGFALIAVALFATNPTRAEFNDWAVHYAMKKMDKEASRDGREVSNNERIVGGAIVNLVVSNVPIERRNFGLFSVFTIEGMETSSDDGNDLPKCVVGVAGQFIGLESC